MKNCFLLFSLLAVMIFSSCIEEKITPSEEITIVNYELAAFTGIRVSSDIKVFLFSDSDVESVEMEANANLQDKVKIEVDNGTLKVGFKNFVNIRGQETLNLRVRTGQLVNDFQASSNAEIHLETPLSLTNATIKVSSDADFFGELDANNLTFDGSSDGEATLFGSIGRLDGELSSDALLTGFGLTVNNLVIKLSSGSEAQLTVAATLDAEAKSDATLRYRGNPQILRLETNSDGEIINVD